MQKLLALAMVAGLLMVAACDTVTPDTTAPTVSIVFPATGATVNKGDIVIKAVATDDKAVTKVEFSIGGTVMGTDNNGAADTFQYTWTDTAAQVAGQNYAIEAKAYDAAENTKTSTTVTITIAGGGSGTGPTEHNQDIANGDSIWYPSGNPHIVTARIHINENGKLTIKPGCIVKFATDCGFEVGHFSPGELVAVGTADSTITFTSNNPTPNAGDWRGFDFYDQTRTSTKFSYCDINYGCYPSYAAVNIEGDQTIGMDHTTIHNSSNWGIWFNTSGGYITGFTGNTITACASYPLYISAEKLSKMTGGNTLSGNGKNAIFVFQGDVSETGTWVNQGVPYFLSTNVYVASSSGAYLTIEKGTTVQFGTSVHLTVGQSDAGGLLADSVTFTSSATTPQKGDWYGIWFYGSATDAQCQLTRCNIGYGGGDHYGNVYTREAVPTITGCNIHDSKGWGIYLEGSDYPNPDSLIAHNTFASNDSGAVYHP